MSDPYARGNRRRGVVAVGLLTVAFIGAACPLAAQRTDEVELTNGNVFIGEVKGLQQGKLSFKIDHANTILFEWEHVVRVASGSFFEVETTDGELHFGTLLQGDVKGSVIVAGPLTVHPLDIHQIVRIEAIKLQFKDRISAHLNLGASYTSADSMLQYSLVAGVGYRTQQYEWSASFSSIETRQQGVDNNERRNFNSSYTRYHTNHYYGEGSLSWAHTTELGLDSRVQLGYTFGRFFTKTNRTRFQGGLGAAVSRENYIGEEPNDYNVAAAFNAKYHFFLFSFPATDFIVDVQVLPGITDWPRYRVEFRSSLEREIIKDFSINLSVYDSYDSEPPPEAPASHDYGMVLSVGMKF